MSAAPQFASEHNTRSAHSTRLNSLREEAAEIRARHAKGEIAADEAARELEALKRKYLRFIDRLIDA